MNMTTQFLYNIANMSLYKPEIVDIVIGVTISITFLVAVRYIFLYHIGWFIVWCEARAIVAKKQVLGDLILMKDIQSEMEKEIEQASLRATFQG